VGGQSVVTRVPVLQVLLILVAVAAAAVADSE